MRFRLVYRGPLASNGTAKQKQEIRRVLHPQLAALWKQTPLSDYPEYLEAVPGTGTISLLHQVANFSFIGLVSSRIHLLAELDVIFFRQQPPGELLRYGGDIDNRVKTLLDALRVPVAQEIPAGDSPRPGEAPFHCLLEDDALVAKLSVDTERWLEDVPENHVMLVIHVNTRPTRGTWGNIGLAS
jgi:hypothetical protein